MSAITELWLVRHGESRANVAADHAERELLEQIASEWRDADVPLSELGERQAAALAQAFQALEPQTLPGAVWVSPYLRARQTAEIALSASGVTGSLVDERLRDRELGVLDLLTSTGVESRYPGEAARRRWLGKFYYRPPGGESWADVALRLRSVLADMDRHPHGATTLVVAHDAIVMVFLYVCLGLSEQELLDFALTHPVANASITRLTRADGGTWSLDVFSGDEHLRQLDVPVTEHEGDKDASIH